MSFKVPFFGTSLIGKGLIMVTSWPATTKALISLDVSILWLIPGMVKIPNILAHSERLKRITMTVNGTIE